MYSVACNVWSMGQINYVAYGYVLCGVWDKCAMWRMVMWRMGQMCSAMNFNVAYGYVAFGTVHTLQKQFPSLLNFVACS